MTYIRSFLAIGLLAIPLLFTGCEKRPQIYQQQIMALGTIVDISLYGTDEQTARQAVDRIEQIMEHLHHDWHAWQPSKLTTINLALAKGDAVNLDPDALLLIGKAKALSEQSQGLFNPAVGRLIALWGFHSDERPDTPPPGDSAIAALLPAPSMAELELDNGRLQSRNPQLELDLGGFAKGYAVDLAIEALRQLGIKNAIVNAGGDLRAIGGKGQQPWRIGIRHPRQPGVIASVETHGDESVFTSGDYERYFDHQGRRYHHIIDPRSGKPARGAASVTIIHSDAATADAAATALLIAGPDDWQSIATSMGIDQVMLIDTEERVYMTQGMAKRIRFEIPTSTAPFIAP